MSEWTEAQEWEAAWHGSCINSLGEEIKQIVYAKKMGLQFVAVGGHPYTLVYNGEKILDVGAGPYSLLLKTRGLGKAVALDPGKYPEWVYARYAAAGVETMIMPAEDLKNDIIYDEVWIYNCLQHVQNPPLIVGNIKSTCKLVRVFEWLEVGLSAGHLHNLFEEDLNKWFGGYGKVENLNESECVGKAYYGIFKGKHYDK